MWTTLKLFTYVPYADAAPCKVKHRLFSKPRRAPSETND